MRTRLVFAIATAFVLALMGSAHAQSFPSKPLKIVVPFPPGGIGDVVGRVLADDMAKNLGHQSECAPGGIRSAQGLQGSRPGDCGADGHCGKCLVACEIAQAPVCDSPRQARRHGVWNTLKRAANTNITHVPYQGGAPALTALMGGHIPIVVGNVTEMVPHAASGKLRVLAVTTGERVDGLPDAPTLRELGFPELESSNWAGVVVAAATPAAVAARLSAELTRSLRSPDVKEKLKANRMVATPSTPDACSDPRKARRS